MIIIDEIVVDDAILKTHFSCCLEICHGHCCATGDFGAPISEEDVEIIDKHLKAIEQYLPDKNIKIIKKNGYTETYRSGSLCIESLYDDGPCVFSYKHEGITKCAIHTYCVNTEIDPVQIKPLSCSLFPIRVIRLGKIISLRYCQYSECKPALGGSTPVFQTCKKGLIRMFDNQWYEKLGTCNLVKEL